METKRSIISLLIAIAISIPLVFAAGTPESVTNVSATAIDTQSVGLSWDAAKDAGGEPVDHYRIYYGTTSVLEAGEGEYDTDADTPNNSTSYVVGTLEANSKYYFAVTAFSTDGVESVEYSWETFATTMAIPGTEDPEAEADTTSPTVASVSAPDKIHVTVEFNEAVKLPSENPESAFSIEEQLAPESMLEIVSAVVDEADETGKTVLFETAEQTVNVNYIITAGIAVTDLSDNPIVSGNTDSGLFIGSDLEPAGAVMDEPIADEPVVDEPVVEDPAMELIDEPAMEETVTDEPVEDVVEEDTTAPEDITALMLDFKEQVDALFTILLDWKPSVDTAKDLVDQIMYMSLDKGNTYDSGKTLGKTASSTEVMNLEGGKEYTFKITTKDETGNESVGVIKAIRLPSSGLGIGFLVLSSAGAAGVALRRKEKNQL